MKDKLVSKEQVRSLHPIFRGKHGNKIINFVFRFVGINKANNIYDASKHLTGTEFEADMLNKLGITRKVENIEILDQFEGQPFITVSNHPYGHIDGITLLSEISARRSDFKMMVNWILGQIDTMGEHFIGVNPYSGNKMADAKSSLGGVKQCISHLKDNHPLGFFPAGGMSDNKLTKTIDREWQPSVLKLIKKVNVPIIPIYITGTNSWKFRLLGFLDWRLRTLRLIHEMKNKKGKTITLRIGEPIMPNEQDKYNNIKDFGEFLKNKTYELKHKK